MAACSIDTLEDFGAPVTAARVVGRITRKARREDQRFEVGIARRCCRYRPFPRHESPSQDASSHSGIWFAKDVTRLSLIAMLSRARARALWESERRCARDTCLAAELNTKAGEAAA